MADLQTIKIRDLIETQQVLTTDYMILEKDTGTFKCQARYLKGATGITPNITIGNTSTLAPGNLATVTKRGNTENPIFDFGIPQGVQGPIGPIGPKGDTPSIAPLQTEIDNRFNALTSQQQGSSEVIEARGGYPALKARLDAISDDLSKVKTETIISVTINNNNENIPNTKNGYLSNLLLEGKTLVVDANDNVVIPGTQGAILKSVGDGADVIRVISKNSDNSLSNYKKVLYKDTDGTWKKPTLRQWDSIEKHSDGKYYYHRRSGNIVLNGSENWVIDTTMPDTHSCFKFDVTDSIIDVKCISDKLNSYIRNEMYNKPIEGVIYSTAFYGGNKCVVNILRSKLSSNTVQGFKNWLQSNNVNVVYKLAQEQVFECTPIDLISYDTQTNYSIECGPIYPKTTLKVDSYLGNVVSILKDKISYLENYITDGLASLLAGGMKGLAEFLYPQDFVSNVDDTVDMEVIE